MVDLTKIEYRVLISLYECEGGITKRNFVKKYPEFKLNTAYLVIDLIGLNNFSDNSVFFE